MNFWFTIFILLAMTGVLLGSVHRLDQHELRIETLEAEMKDKNGK